MARKALQISLLALVFIAPALAAGPARPIEPRTMASGVDVRTSAVSISTMSVGISSGTAVSRAAWRNAPNTVFQAGEDCYFVVRWGIVTGGYSTLAVHGVDVVEGRPAYHLVEDAHSTGLVDTFYSVHDRNDVWLDTASLTTVRYEKRIREGRYRVEQTVTLDQARHRYFDHSYRLDKKSYEDIEGDAPPDVLDVLGSLYYVRTLPMEVGRSYTFDVYDSGKVWPLVVDVKKREKVKVPAGKFDCFRVEPLLRGTGIFASKGKKLEVWLTADERRLPVLMRSEIFIGHVSAELVSYHQVAIPSTPPPQGF